MHTLYYSPGAASMAVHWLLIELDLPYELSLVNTRAGEQKRPEYLALNPNGVVPTLVSDGVAHYEVAALLAWIAERHPRGGFAPGQESPRRADYLQWMFNLANTVQPLFRLWWYPHEPAGEDCADAVRGHVAPRIEVAWDRIDAHLSAHGPHMLGDRLSAVDFYLVMLMRWSRDMPRPASDWRNLSALAARLKARPSFGTLCEREGLEDWT